MPPSSIAIEPAGDVTVLRLSHPPANAIDLEFALAFEAAFAEAMAGDPQALVLTGTGEFFSAGLNLKTVPGYSPEDQRGMLKVINRLLGALYGCPVPVVGAINGHAVAAGFILALNADYRVGPRGDFQVGLTEARVGIPFPAASMIILQAELTPQQVRFTTLQARNFGPDEALERGVFDELRPAGEVRGRALEIARDMASIPSDAYRRIKYQVREGALARIAEINATDADPMIEGWLSPEAPSASAALLEG
ncbi:MAG: hypothetical protein CL910_02290 [Deltaproteobacteria bacterium]|jgi:enoyl-CoA hydratase|nr:hypothetical protein [Deltaproteobacteria bacterium]